MVHFPFTGLRLNRKIIRIEDSVHLILIIMKNR